MKTGLYYHLPLNIHSMKATMDTRSDSEFKDLTGHSKKVMLAYCQELEKKGYSYIPACKNFDNQGHCRGHKRT